MEVPNSLAFQNLARDVPGGNHGSRYAAGVEGVMTNGVETLEWKVFGEVEPGGVGRVPVPAGGGALPVGGVSLVGQR